MQLWLVACGFRHHAYTKLVCWVSYQWWPTVVDYAVWLCQGHTVHAAVELLAGAGLLLLVALQGKTKNFTIKDCHRNNAVVATLKKGAAGFLPCM